MAVIGAALAVPESGWTRYDGSYPDIKYTGTWLTWDRANFYGRGLHTTTEIGSTISFKFKGTDLRILTYTQQGGFSSSYVEIEIDGQKETYVEVGLNWEDVLTLVYEKEGLEDTIHNVKITAMDKGTTYALTLDAIDTTGYLIADNEVSDFSQMDIGKRIRCNYWGSNHLAQASLSSFGKASKPILSPSIPGNTPYGDFYLICVDKDVQGRYMLIADRNLQTGVTVNDYIINGMESFSGTELIYEHVILTENMLSASDSSGSNTPDKTIDGTHHSSWQSVNSISYFQIDLGMGNEKRIQRISLSKRNGSPSYFPKDFMIKASNDNANWTTLSTLASIPDPNILQFVHFDFANANKYRYYRLDIQKGQSSVAGIGEIRLYEKTKYKITTKLLTGGTSASDFNNDWDKYIVNSTLNGTIAAGDDKIWNWSSMWSMTRSSKSTDATRRIFRGKSAVNQISDNTGVYSAIDLGFRPMIIVDYKPTKSLIYHNGAYKKYIPETPKIYGKLNSTMTSNTTPSGIVNASSSYDSTYTAWRAFDGYTTSGTYYWNSKTTSNEWLSYEFEQPKVVDKYILITSGGVQVPKDWTFEGSHDGINWTVLDTQKSFSSFKAGVREEFKINNTIAYKKYRIFITTGNGGSYIYIWELELHGIIQSHTGSQWVTLTSAPSQQLFEHNGIDDLSILNRNEKMTKQSMIKSTLGKGSLFKTQVDYNKFIEINRLDIK
ncbi:discoidin domain-containing protein [Paenibacillus sp. ACRRX]|uniref:discoidin domain-containing protein n=1 Tax=Paenibacillus sp. ACRRX TaxID=2918206 RepID=UPI001EF6B928|nr:discoidin domain-containing protein [Paenibacillus sp. ACRRX]MCG7406374.1 discoidin domain-containing protein [Paenibacillus sp. ACRRX]